MNTPDRLDIQRWAKVEADALREEIRTLVEMGWDTKTAVETVLTSSCIGAGYKSQIRYEFK